MSYLKAWECGLLSRTRIIGACHREASAMGADTATYSKGHYIVSEYADKVFNKHCPTYPWQVRPSFHSHRILV